MSERRVLVTGATGFIGCRALQPLLERGFEVHAVARSAPSAGHAGVHWHEADVLDQLPRRGLVADIGATHLLHLAWYAEPGAFWAARENAAWVAATIDLVEAFAARGGQRVVAAGSCAEYDWTAIDGPIGEDAPIGPSTFYGVCKDATRRVLAGLASQAELSHAWGRVFFLYGPGEDERRLVGGVAQRLVAGERAMSSAGTQVRDFLHVDDVAGAFARLVDAEVTGPVNIASGERATVREIVETIARAAGAEDLLDIGALPTRQGDPPEIVADVARLRAVDGEAPRVSLEVGIAAIVESLRAARA